MPDQVRHDGRTFDCQDIKIRRELSGTFRTDAMAEFSKGMFPDEQLNLIPVSLIIPDFLARGADGQHTAQDFHLTKSIFQFNIQLFQGGGALLHHFLEIFLVIDQFQLRLLVPGDIMHHGDDVLAALIMKGHKFQQQIVAMQGDRHVFPDLNDVFILFFKQSNNALPVLPSKKIREKSRKHLSSRNPSS